jgi:hypothetical protein
LPGQLFIPQYGQPPGQSVQRWDNFSIRLSEIKKLHGQIRFKTAGGAVFAENEPRPVI